MALRALGVPQAFFAEDSSALTQAGTDLLLLLDRGCATAPDPQSVRERFPNAQMLAFHSQTVEDGIEMLLALGARLGIASRARQAAVRLRGMFFDPGEFVNPFDDPTPTVFVLNADDAAVEVAGGAIVQLLERAGCSHPLNPTATDPASDDGAGAGPQQGSRKAGPPRRVAHSDFADAIPQRVIVCPPAGTLERARAASDRLARHVPGWRDLPAVRAGRVALVDGQGWFHTPGFGHAHAFAWLVGWTQGREQLTLAEHTPGPRWETLEQLR
jgi:hypothetical protein